MTLSELPNMLEEDDLSILVEQLKNGLVSRAIGNLDDFSDDEYKKLRKIVLGIPEIGQMLPRFIKTCRNLNEFWAYIKPEAGSYAERRKILGDIFNPIIDKLEYDADEGSLEFTRNYEEKEIIGQGGFGLVYLYEHKFLQLPFAVKVFAPAFYKGGEKELERFFQEAKMLFSLNHKSIIKIYDAGMIGKRPFIRMEYFDGLNLNEALSKYGIFEPQRALILIENIVLGLAHAHEEIGIIHRDLKPSNIMVSYPNKFRIIDFGLGIFIENELHSRITKTGQNIISGHYNAPELLENPKLIDKRSDIYSIGAIWFTVLVGQPPAGTTIIEQLKSIENITENYINCIYKCLASIENRYISCVELLENINELKK